MNDTDSLTAHFEQRREHLRKVAYRMLGSSSDADDAVQEAWLRLARAEHDAIDNLGGWLTAVVARICLDMLRSRKTRHEQPAGGRVPESPPARRADEPAGPEAELLLGEALAPALLVVLERLTPAERVSFVLHDMFDLPFDEIAAIVGRSETAARQLASRARRRVRGLDPATDVDTARHRAIVDAFLAASRDGDLDALLAVLAPDAVLRADARAVKTAAANRGRHAPDLSAEVVGAERVAETFKGKARGARTATIDGRPGAVWIVGGEVRSAFVFTIANDRIAEIALVMEPERLADLEIDLARS